MKVKIYKLTDPLTKQVRYVGKTERPLNYRLSVHIYSSLKNKKKTHKEAWITSLHNKNLKPIIELLEEVNFENWQEKEIYWISKFENLTNTAIGGMGSNGKVYTESERLEKSILIKKLIYEGKIIYSKERAIKISNSSKGKIIKDSTREKLRLANLGKKKSLETKLKLVKIVLREDFLGNIVEFYSMTEAARNTLSTTKGNISSACHGRLKTYKGYKWRFKI